MARTSRNSRSNGGSVLVPLVSAMLILLLVGVSISETFGVQRRSSVLTVQAAQAQRVAEAGVWHAANQGAAITTAVTFGGGEYTVTKSGDTYTSTGSVEGAKRVVTLTITAASGGGSSDGPLDESASQATATVNGNDKFNLDLINETSSSITIESFTLSASASMTNAKQLELDSNKIWDGDESIPTGTVTMNEGSSSDRRISGSATDTAEFQFMSAIGDVTIEHTLVINFTDGTSSTLTFTLDWDD